MDNNRIQKALEILEIHKQGEFQLLGQGFTSVVFHDSKKVYKVCMFSGINSLIYKKAMLASLKYKLLDFENSAFFYPIHEIIENDQYFIIVYDYEPSEPCTTFSEEELVPFLAECWQRRLIFQDIKPDNFIRVNGQLKWIDYEPDKYTDNLFLNSAVRTFIYCKYPELDESFLHKLCRSAVNQFDLSELNGFQAFCNRVFAQIIFQESQKCIQDATNQNLMGNEIVIDCLDIDDLFWRLFLSKSAVYRLPFSEITNPESLYFRLLKQGFILENLKHGTLQLCENNFFKTDSFTFSIKELQKPRFEVSLLIKSCAQDSAVIYELVKHLVKQTASPDMFCERVLALDTQEKDFLRQYNDSGNFEELISEANRLVKDGIIDGFIVLPHEDIPQINFDWFGLESHSTHTKDKVPVAAQLYAFEQMKGKYFLQMDCDVMIARKDYEHSFLADMIQIAESNERVISVGFNICKPEKDKFIEYYGFENGGFVPEVRCGLFHKERLLSLIPFPNQSSEAGLQLSWYRSMHLKQKETGFCSVRGGDTRSFYIHPDNYRKTDKDVWFTILNQVEQNIIPALQENQFDLAGSYYDWALPKRNEPMVVVTCLRNIPFSRFLRFWYSLKSQTFENWGLILIDDASDNGLNLLIRGVIEDIKEKVTFIHNRFRVGVGQNTYKAIHYFMDNDESVVVVIDGDDALIGNHTLKNIYEKYIHQAADVVVGKMYRTDKLTPHYLYASNFINPRLTGGNVWQHLRSFKKYLFDSLRFEDIKIQTPIENLPLDKLSVRKISKRLSFPEHCWDFAYMVPIVEMCSNPIQIHHFNYLHDRTTPNSKEIKAKKENEIAEILNKKPKTKNDIVRGRRNFMPNLKKIEIDITYDCNLKCINCNRSSTQAPTHAGMSLQQIQGFISESKELQIKWELINLLGGEPTIHPQFLEIVNELLYEYIIPESPETILQITSNGFGELVNERLSLIPQHKNIIIDTASFKEDKVVPYFSPFNQAPMDEEGAERQAFHKGCWVTAYCGIGLNQLGYYPCGVAAGIDRVAKLNRGIQKLADVEAHSKELLNTFCRYCGNFTDYAVNNGDFIPRCEKPALKKPIISSTWRDIYRKYNSKEE